MAKNFTQFAFTETVKSLQEQKGSRKSYERMENSGDRYLLGPNEIAFIQSRDSCYLSTVGSNGWPYLQHRGGKPGFLRVVDETTLAFPDYSGNRQYISAGNVVDSEKACLFLIDYPSKQRLKIWATAEVTPVDESLELVEEFNALNSKLRIERVFILKIQGFDWNCPQHITPRYTLEQLASNPAIIENLNA